MILYTKFLFSLVLLKFALFTSPAGKAPALISAESLNFGALYDGKKVVVSWKNAAGERSFDYFTIERSKDGVNFMSAVMIKGAGKLSGLVDYMDVDYNPFSGISYYRLKRTDYSGESSFSEAIPVNFQFTKDGNIEPFTNKLPDASELKDLENKSVLVLLKDPAGQEFISKIRVSIDNEHLYVVDSKGSLNPGTYRVIASSCNRLCSQELIVR